MRRLLGRNIAAGAAVFAISACQTGQEIESALERFVANTDALLLGNAAAIKKADNVSAKQSRKVELGRQSRENEATGPARTVADPKTVGVIPEARSIGNSDPRYIRLAQIFDRLVAASRSEGGTGKSISFDYFDDPQWDILALDENKLVFFSGLVETVNDDELAALIGHQIAHNTVDGIDGISVPSGSGRAGKPQRRKGSDEEIPDKSERRADELGILYAALAGYDPHAAAALLERQGGSGYAYFRSHPPGAGRVQRNRDIARKVQQYYRRGELNPDARKILDCNILFCRRSPAPLPNPRARLLAAAEAHRLLVEKQRGVGAKPNGTTKAAAPQKSRTGEAYRGDRRNGVAHGRGEWTSGDGHRYVGEFRDGNFHGDGTYYWPNGELYSGDFRLGKFHGKGEWRMAGGERYSGDVRDGVFHGTGIYYWPNGERYEGDFREGKFYGAGEWKMANGERYIGDIRDEEFHGCGAYIWPSGEYYAGEFRHDKFHGAGSYAWPDGRMDTCEWRQDKAVEGSCIEHRVGGALPEPAEAVCFRRASWRSRLPVPRGEHRTLEQDGLAGGEEGGKEQAGAAQDRAEYEGPHRDGKPHGRGVLTFPNGDRYEGEFADGEIRGRGRMILANGDEYGGEGVFDDRGYQGCGMYVRANGDRYVGEFRNGRFHGRGTYEWRNGLAATCDWREGERQVDSCVGHRAVGVGKRYKGYGICGTLTMRDVRIVKKRKR